MTLPTAKEFKDRANSMVSEITAWAKEEFHLGNLPVKLRFTDRRLNYYGQAATKRDKQERFTHFEISLSSFNYLRHEHVAFGEYASFNHSKVIGGFETTDWRLGLDTLVAHEMAHIIQFALRMAAFDHKAVGREHPLISGWNGATPVFGMRMGAYEGNHGSFFQRIYQLVRHKFINHRVPREAYTAPRRNFIVPDDFEERLARMPKSGLEGIRFMSNGRELEVAGRNPNTRKRLYNYQVREVATGRFLGIKMSSIARLSAEALERIKADEFLNAEFTAHCVAVQSKFAANAKSSATKAWRSRNRRMAA